MLNVAKAPARDKGKITFLDAKGNEVAPGSPDAVTVRVEGFRLLQNGAFRIVSTFHHPCPPPVSSRRCKTRNGVLPAPDAEETAEIAVQAAEKIDTAVDPPNEPWWYELGGDDLRAHPENDALYHPEDFIWTYHDDGTISCRPRPDEIDEFLDALDDDSDTPTPFKKNPFLRPRSDKDDEEGSL